MFMHAANWISGYNTKDDWCAAALQRPGASYPTMPIMSPTPYLLSRFTSNVPLPTLYAGDSVRKPKLSVVEVLLYNMASLLAGVAAGYDVRMSNVSPLHPTLLSELPALKTAPLALKTLDTGETQTQPVTDDSGQGGEWLPKSINVDVTRKFAANTYHGTGKAHTRPALSSLTYAPLEPALELLEAQVHKQQQSLARRVGGSQPYYTPLQRTPQHSLHQQPPPPAAPALTMAATQTQQPSTFSNTSGLGSSALYSSSLGSQSHSHTQPPTPSPRRKTSTSSFTEQLEYSPLADAHNADVFEEFRVGGGIGPPPLYAPADYLRNGPSYANDGAHRKGYFGSNYFPYRPELNYVYERDCKSYPDYSYDYNNRLPNYYDYQYESPAQLPAIAPASVPVPTAHALTQLAQTRTPPPRVPQMGVSAAGHRRTPSTVSNNSNVLLSSGFALEPEELLSLPPELYDYNNLNVVDYEREAYHEPTKAQVIVPPPTKQELYAGSPKLLNRLSGTTGSLNRLREYEPSFAHVSPLPKTKFAQPAQQLIIQERPASLPFEQHTLNYQQQLAGRAATAQSQQQQQQLPLSQQAQQQQQQQTQTQLSSNTKLRSSLKKYNNGEGRGNSKTTPTALNGSISSQQGTPTNPTPPDSLTSDDSSYLSAKEGSISSQHSRVRFSPDAYLDTGLPAAALSRRMTAPLTTVASIVGNTQQQQRRKLHSSSASTPSPSPSSSS